MTPKKDLQLEVYANNNCIENYEKSLHHLILELKILVHDLSSFFVPVQSYEHLNLQMWIPLSSCESKYHALSQVLKESRMVMKLLKEINNRGFSDK